MSAAALSAQTQSSDPDSKQSRGTRDVVSSSVYSGASIRDRIVRFRSRCKHRLHASPSCSDASSGEFSNSQYACSCSHDAPELRVDNTR